MTKQELIEKHGTLEEFEKAVWAACDDLLIMTAEAVDGINKYKVELSEASDDQQESS